MVLFVEGIDGSVVPNDGFGNVIGICIIEVIEFFKVIIDGFYSVPNKRPSFSFVIVIDGPKLCIPVKLGQL